MRSKLEGWQQCHFGNVAQIGSQALGTHCKLREMFHICKSCSFHSPVASSVQLHRPLLGHTIPVPPGRLSGKCKSSKAQVDVTAVQSGLLALSPKNDHIQHEVGLATEELISYVVGKHLSSSSMPEGVMVASRMRAICLTNLSRGLCPTPPSPCRLSDAPVPCTQLHSQHIKLRQNLRSMQRYSFCTGKESRSKFPSSWHIHACHHPAVALVTSEIAQGSIRRTHWDYYGHHMLAAYMQTDQSREESAYCREAAFAIVIVLDNVLSLLPRFQLSGS
jgi:hypothetical protein